MSVRRRTLLAWGACALGAVGCSAPGRHPDDASPPPAARASSPGSGRESRPGPASRPSPATAVPAAAAGLGVRARLGAYVDGMVADPRRLADFEARVSPVEVASYFYGFGDEFPAAIEARFADGGRRDVLVAWDMGSTRFTDWSAGRHDDYLRTIARHAAAYPHPLHVRPWPEMNGDWQAFQPTASGSKPHGGTPAEFVAAWRHVVSVIRDGGGTNVRWVFNPTADTTPWTTDVRAIWPGPGYVDVLGLDGFNWGDGGSLRWRGFEDIFREQYDRVTALHPAAPVWICEYGSKEPSVDDGAPADAGHTKGRWLAEMFSCTAFPRITTLIAFDARKERDWRADSSRDSLDTWHTLVARRGHRAAGTETPTSTTEQGAGTP